MEATKAKEVCPTTTQGLIKQGALLVDVRELNEINEVSFDVPRILLIPLSELEDRWQEIPKEGDVIFVCAAGGKKSLVAQRISLRTPHKRQTPAHRHTRASWRAPHQSSRTRYNPHSPPPRTP